MKKITQFSILIIFLIIGCTAKSTQGISKDGVKKESTKVEINSSEVAKVPTDVEVSKSKNEILSSNSSKSPIPDVPINSNLVQGILENGMKYYILKNAKPENRAELRLAVNAGAMQEDDNQKGLAHFVEHMAFNGSKNFKKNELVNYLESTGTRFGADLNAYTSFDETVYMLQVRTDIDSLYKKGLLVLEDWSANISFDEEEIDKERGVVTSEWRTRLSPNQRMQQEYFPKMYFGSRYAERLPIGEPEIINNAPYELFRKFYNDWYRPEAMAVIVVGDIDVEDTKNYIIENFSKYKAKTPARPKLSNDVPDHKETIVSIVTDTEAPFTQVQMMYKHDAKKVKNIVDYKENIRNNLYNSMLNKRLEEIANGPNPPFIFAYSGFGEDVGQLAVYRAFLNVPEDKIMEGLSSVVRENERVLRHGFNQSELDRAKIETLERYKSLVLEKDKTESRRYATGLVYHFLDENPFMSPEQTLELVEDFLPQIFLSELNMLAKQWVTDENRVVVITAPEKDGVIIPVESDVLAELSAVKLEDIKPYVDKVITEPLFSRNLISGEIISSKILPINNIKEYVLSNGAKVVLKTTDFKNDELLLAAYSPGGHASYTGDKYINADNATSIVTESGLGQFSFSDLDKLLAGKNVSVYPYISENYDGFSGSCSPKDLETFFQMLNLYFTEPRVDEEAFESYKSKQKAFFQNILSNPDYYFMDYTDKIKTNNNLKSGIPTSDMIDKLDLKIAMDIYKKHFSNASDFVFTFVGNVDEADFEKMIKLYIGSLPGTNTIDPIIKSDISYVKGDISKTINKGKAKKTQVELFYHGDIDDSPASLYKFNSMIDILKIKMRESLREDKGGVYGVRVSGNVDKIKKAYSIAISFNCDPGREQELIETAIKDIDFAKTSGAAESDLNKIKETQIQSLTKDLKENRYWSRQISDAYRFGNNPENIGLETLQQFVNSLTSDDIKAATGAYFGNNKIQLIMQPAIEQEN